MCQRIFLAIKLQEKNQNHVPKVLKELFKLSNLWINIFYFKILREIWEIHSASTAFPSKQKPSLIC